MTHIVKALDSLPEYGETWKNIHTGMTANVLNITNKEVGLVISSNQKTQIKIELLSTFLNNWKRVKSPNPWFVGFADLLLKE